LLERPYRVGGSSDRVGLRIEGPGLVGLEFPSRQSAPVAPGAVQVAGGRVLILGVAGGTMGGYPHVAHVIAADLDRLGQARPGDMLSFARVELAEARALDRAQREWLASRNRRIALGSVASTAD
jgi:allophanate hydrolase subunit 2